MVELFLDLQILRASSERAYCVKEIVQLEDIEKHAHAIINLNISTG